MGQPVVHFEIIGNDPAMLRSYYGDLFGWGFALGDATTEAVSQPGNYGFVHASTTGEGGIPGTDKVTGARAELSLLVDLPRERLWELVTDVARYGEWSPECEYSGWLDDAAGRPPRVGDRFAGRNRFGKAFVTSVVCVVTALSWPETFEWVVLDASGEVDRPASIWRYELSTGDRAHRSRLQHSFVHGPGETMARTMAGDDPAELDRRLAELRQNMAVSLAAMLDGERYKEEPR